ncbi:MAG TPA: hypothetical protein VFG50_13960 [Rhodothermales bacterium]|nr:hypothetical protein [Rhodothermales bacterium]
MTPRARATMLLLLAGSIAASATADRACAQPQLYAGLIRTQGYVVGSPLSESGLYRLTGDSTWVHVGWNNPRISAIASDPTDPDVLYLGAGNGVLRTEDGGRSWRITTDWHVTEAQDIAVDPNAPEQVYVATPYGIWRSRDHGQTWTGPAAVLPPDRMFTQTLAIDRTRAGRLFAGTWDGLFLSEDGGASWAAVSPFDGPVLDVEQSPNAPGVWLAGAQGNGVFRSGDGGRTWQRVGGSLSDKVVYSVAMDPLNARNMAAAGWGTGVYVSTDGGETWARRGSRLPVQNVYEVLFDAVRPGRLWAATVEQGIFRSDDLGRTWQPAGMDGTLVFDMTFIDRKQP